MPHKKWRRISRILYSKPILVLLAIVAVFAVYTSFSAYQKMRATGEQVADARDTKQELADRRSDLRTKLDALGTTRGQEAQIRRTYSVTKDGEHMVVIIDNEPTDTSTSSPERGIWGNIWASITGIFY